jgi:uncharacterized membrane protein
MREFAQVFTIFSTVIISIACLWKRTWNLHPSLYIAFVSMAVSMCPTVCLCASILYYFICSYFQISNPRKLHRKERKKRFKKKKNKKRVIENAVGEGGVGRV